MKMKQLFAIMTAIVLTIGANAQSLNEGIKMYKYERYQTAKKVLTPLAANDPIANYYLGLSELGMGNTSAAKDIFAKYPESYANISGMARVAYASGNDATAKKILEDLVDEAKRKNVEPYKYAADAATYAKKGDKQQAVEWYKLFLERNENDHDVMISQGDAYQQLQSGGGAAMTNYEKVVDADPKNSLAFSRIGKLWYDAKTYDKALEAWKKAQTADPTNPLPYRDLANAYMLTGKYDLAKENIEKYLEYSDKSLDDQERYLDILYLSKNYDKAIETANDLINKGVVEPRFYGILAFSQMEIEDTANALTNIRTYFKQTPTEDVRPLTYLKYGTILLMNSMEDSANFYYNKYISMDTSTDNKLKNYRDIADAFKKERNWAVAGEWFQKITTDYPDKAEVNDYFYAGYYNYYSKNYEIADTMFAQMVSKYPEQPTGLYWRGRTNAAKDASAEEGLAKPYYEEWLDVQAKSDEYNPKDKDLMQAYQYLAVYYYNQKDCDNIKKYMDAITTIEAENKLVDQLSTALPDLGCK